MTGNIETAAWIIAFAIILHGCQPAPSITVEYAQGLTGQEVQK
jgi:hypothetical protein